METEEIIKYIIDKIGSGIDFEQAKELIEAILQERVFIADVVLKDRERALLEAKEQWRKEAVEKLPKQYEDKKLGRTDLTLNEMFERGYNSCLIQIRNLIEKI